MENKETGYNDEFKNHAKKYNHQPGIEENARLFADKICAEHQLNGDEILFDFGAGTGLVGLQFVKKVGKVIFLDPSENMLNVLSETLKEEGIQNAEIINGFISDYKGPKVDLVVCSLSLHHCDNLNETLQGIAKILKEDGKIYVIEFKKGDKGHGFDVNDLIDRFMTYGFSNVKVQDFGKLTLLDKETGGIWAIKDKIFLEAQVTKKE